MITSLLPFQGLDFRLDGVEQQPRSQKTYRMMLWWLLPLLGGLPVLVVTGKESDSLSISFNDHVRPILSDKCYACHGPDPEDRAANLRLDTEEGAFADLGGYRAITPGDPEESEIFWRIESEEDDKTCPHPTLIFP